MSGVMMTMLGGLGGAGASAGLGALSGAPDFEGALHREADQYVLESPAVLTVLRRESPNNPLLTGDFGTLGGVLRSLEGAEVSPSRRAKWLSGLVSAALAFSPAVVSGLIVYQQTGSLNVGAMAGVGAGVSVLAGAVAGKPPSALAAAIAGAGAAAVVGTATAAVAAAGVSAVARAGVAAGAIAGATAVAGAGAGAGVVAGAVSEWVYPRLRDGLDNRVFQRGGSPEKRVMEYVEEMGGSLGLIESDPSLFGDFLETRVVEMFRGEEGKARGRVESLTAQAERLRASIQEQRAAIEAQAPEAETRRFLLARLEQAQREMENLIAEEVQKEGAIIESIQRFLEGISDMRNDLRKETRAMALSEAVASIEAAVDRLRADTERREMARIESVVSMAAYVARLQKMGEELTLLLAARREVEELLRLPS